MTVDVNHFFWIDLIGKKILVQTLAAEGNDCMGSCVCWCVCVCVYVCVCVFCMCVWFICLYMSLHVSICLYMSLYVSIFLYTCMRTHKCSMQHVLCSTLACSMPRMHKCMHVCLCVWANVCEGMWGGVQKHPEWGWLSAGCVSWTRAWRPIRCKRLNCRG